MAVEFAKVAEAPGPMAVALRPVAVAPSPKAAPPFAALAAAPTATEPVATAPLPIAMELTPVLWLAPMAIAPFPLATAFVPMAVAFSPLAWAFTPHPNDDAAADAPLLLTASELTTGVVVGITAVRTGAVVTLSPLTKLAVLAPVTAGAEFVWTLVAAVKNWPVAGGLKPVTTGSEEPGIWPVTKLLVIGFTLATTSCEVPWPVTTV